MGILSNYATDSLVTASCRIAFRYLIRQKEQGREIAEKIAWLVSLRKLILIEAATHNKGILTVLMPFWIATGTTGAIGGGGPALLVETGAIKVSVAGRWILKEKNWSVRYLLPMPEATKGGSIGPQPTCSLSHDLLGKSFCQRISPDYSVHRSWLKILRPLKAFWWVRDPARPWNWRLNLWHFAGARNPKLLP